MSDLSCSEVEMNDDNSWDDELWIDWQKIKEADDQLMQESLSSKKQKNIKKFLNDPVIIETKPGELESVSLPEIFRYNSSRITKTKTSHVVQTLVSRSKKNVDKTKAIVTIGEEIRPVQLAKKANGSQPEKLTKVTLSREEFNESEVNDSMIIDDDSTDQQSSENQSESPENSQTENSVQDVQNVKSPVPHFYTLDNKVICIIEPQTKFSFYGKLRIKVLFGAVKIYGSKLDKFNTISPVEVYSYRGSSLVTIESTVSSKSPGSISEVWETLIRDNIDKTIENSFQFKINNLTDGWAVLSIQPLDNTLTKFLANYYTHRLFPKIKDTENYPWFDKKRAEIFLQAYFYPNNSGKRFLDFTKTNEFCENIVKRCENSELCKVLIAGGKNVGKSTTAINLINRLLDVSEAVVYVDFDHGQSEFTPACCISLNIVQSPLLGPNFTHLKAPYHQIYIGDADTNSSIESYIEGIQKLVKCLNDSDFINKYPVVINTMGYTKGIGWEIICYLIRAIKPSDVLQIISTKITNFHQSLTASIVNLQSLPWNYSNNLEHYSNHQLYTLNSEAENQKSIGEFWNIQAHQRREISMMAYLSGIISNCDKTLLENNRNEFKTINEIVPYAVPFSAISVSLDRPVTPHVLSVMNGNIVALCGYNFDDNNMSKEPEENSPEYPKVLLKASAATCYGFGIVRGVDMKSKKLYINTPLALSRLSHVNCLIGSMLVPSGLLQLNKPGLPYIGGECDLPTTHDSRRGYFRMRQPRSDA